MLLLCLVVWGCLTVHVQTPDGTSTADYKGTTIFTGESVSCGSVAGVISCTGSGQNLQEIAMAIAPYIAPALGVPLPVPPRPSATPTPAAGQ